MRCYYFPGHVVELVSFWLEFKNSFKVEAGVLYWLPFMNIYQFCCIRSQDFAFETSHILFRHYCRSSNLPSIHLQPFMKSHFHFPIFVESAEYQVISSVVRTSDQLRVIPVSKSWLVLKNEMFDYRLPLVPSMSSGGLKAASANCWQPCHLHVSIV